MWHFWEEGCNQDKHFKHESFILSGKREAIIGITPSEPYLGICFSGPEKAIFLQLFLHQKRLGLLF